MYDKQASNIDSQLDYLFFNYIDDDWRLFCMRFCGKGVKIMKYELEFEVQAKRPVIPLNLKIDEETVRDFKFVSKQVGVSMTHVLTKMLKEFVIEHRSKGLPKQREMF